MKKRHVNLTTEAHRPAFNDFADAMRATESKEGWRSSETLRHFLDAAFCSIKGRFLMGEAWTTNEAEYMAIVGRCRHPKETLRSKVMSQETQRAFVFLILMVLVTGWFQENLRRDVRFLDARVTNIEAAK